MIGGNPQLSDLRFHVVLQGQDGPVSSGLASSSLALSISLLIKAGLGTDPFVLVETLKTGVIQCLIIAVFMLFLTYGSFELLLHCWHPGEATSYDVLWSQLIHAGTRWVPLLLISLGYIAGLCFCFWDIIDCVPTVLAWLWPDAPEYLADPWFLQYVFGVVVVLPSIASRGFRGFAWVAWVSNFFELLALSAALVYFFRHMFQNGKYVAAPDVILFQPDFESIYGGLRDFNICFYIHPVVPLIAQEMAKGTKSRVKKMTWWSLIFVGIFSYLTPLLSYLFFVDEEMVSCFFIYLEPAGSPEVIIGTISVIIVATCSNMYFAFMSSQAILAIWDIGVEEKRMTGLRVFGSLVSVLVAICLNFAGDLAFLVFYELSSFAYTVLGFVMPALFFLVHFKVKAIGWGILSLFVFAVGSFLTVLSLKSCIEDASLL
jgi:hypothetical protein